MSPFAAAIRDARKAVKLSEPMMARLAGIDRDQLVRFEAGKDEIPAAVLERYARMFGLGIRSFVAGDARRAPLGMLFRSMFEGSRPSVGQLASTGAHLVLGEMLRSARERAELRERLGESWGPSPIEAFASVPVEPASRTPHGAEALAACVRERFHLGEGPIPSMLSFVQDRLGIEVLWVTPDELDRDIDAASALAPHPVILVNLIGGAEQWWRTRMTLAHEVCHLLFDRDFLSDKRHRGFVLFSPSSPHGPERSRGVRSRWYFSEAFEHVEQRANAFAAYLLAPPGGVRALVAGLDPRSESAISLVCKKYGVGRETAINLLQNVHRLSHADRMEMRTRPHVDVLAADPEGRFHEPVPRATGLRRGALQDLVLRALAAGRIDPAEARDYLRLSLDEELPPHAGLSEVRRAPLRSREVKVGQAAERYLSNLNADELLYAGRLSPDPGGGFRVEVLAGRGRGPFRPVGHLRMTEGLEVVKSESHLDLTVGPEKNLDAGPAQRMARSA